MQQHLEHWGLFHISRYLNRRHLFSRTPRRYLARRAARLSFMIGFGITLITVSLDIFFITRHGQSLLSVEWELLVFIISANAGMIAIEFWLLFHIGFQATARYIHDVKKVHPISVEQQQTLIRAVLELDEPLAAPFGLNPHRHNSKHRWLSLLAYKLKVLFSNALAKLLISRLLGRSAARGYAPLIATLITGFWDAWVQADSLKEVRLRLSAQIYSRQLLLTLQQKPPSHRFREALIRLIALRLERFGGDNYALNWLLNALEQQQPQSVSGLTALSNDDTLSLQLRQLSHQEQQQLSHIACTLLVFKRRPLNQREQQLARLFQLQTESIKQRRKALDCPITQLNEHETEARLVRLSGIA